MSVRGAKKQKRFIGLLFTLFRSASHSSLPWRAVVLPRMDPLFFSCDKDTHYNTHEALFFQKVIPRNPLLYDFFLTFSHLDGNGQQRQQNFSKLYVTKSSSTDQLTRTTLHTITPCSSRWNKSFFGA